MSKKGKLIHYKGFEIDNCVTYPNLITVFFNGDDIIFKSVDEAKKEIDKYLKSLK